MSTQNITLDVEARKALRKGLNKLRGQGIIPAVIHNHGQESTYIQADYLVLSKVFHSAGKHHPVQLDLNGKKHLVLIKDVDFEPVKRKMRHVVFQAIKRNEKVEAEIPIVFEGEAPAARKSLLVLKQLDTVKVEALPKYLVDNLVVDMSSLEEVGNKLTVADINVPEGVAILTEPEHQIAVVEMPKDQVAEAEAATEELAGEAEGPTEEEAETKEQTPVESPSDSKEGK